MKKRTPAAALVVFGFLLADPALDAKPPDRTEVIAIEGIAGPVEIIKDRWGIAHITAGNENDLFFAQGFNAAADRLFQLELWRRLATGTLAEWLGPPAVRRDIGARLLRYRGDMSRELSHYHPRGREIIGSFVRGINAYILLTRLDPSLLPLEFKLLGARPGEWTPEIVVSRHNGLYRNATAELALARAVRAVGPEKLEELLDLHPGNPSLVPAPGLALDTIPEGVLSLYSETRAALRFRPGDLLRTAAGLPPDEKESPARPSPAGEPDVGIEGSNNWVVSGRLSRSGSPLLASDPHRVLQVPALRYWVHLRAPGWNVIGAGEPALPGVSIGHNEHGAWGQTTFSADQEDIYVYETNPEGRDRYRYRGHWEKMKVIREKIKVRGAREVEATLKFTRHGPVLYEDEIRHKAYALRAAWLETGCASYLASLRLDQARTWDDFRAAVFASRTPSLNFVWADRSGDIGWQMAGITPLRRSWPGLLPVPGDGRFEWQGFIPPPELPSLRNPAPGFIATANEDNLPAGYPYQVGYIWDAPFRVQRIAEVLGAGPAMDLADMTALQQDELSIPARRLVPLLKGLHPTDALVRECLGLLQAWDFKMAAGSAAAAVYQAWQRALVEAVNSRLFPPELAGSVPGRSLPSLLARVASADPRLAPGGPGARDALLIETLGQAAGRLKELFGPDTRTWRYGNEKFHRVHLRHPLSAAAGPDVRRRIDVGPLPRGGNGQTVNMTSDFDEQLSGATFRIVVDLADWDLAVGTNAPGQSGDPDDPHYSDLFKPWVEGRYFPAYFSREKFAAEAERTLVLRPADSRGRRTGSSAASRMAATMLR